MSESDNNNRNNNLINSFSKMIQLLDNETKTLKSYLNIKETILNERSSNEIISNLNSLENNINNLEYNLSDFEEYLNEELNSIENIENIHLKGIKQYNKINEIEQNLPSFFKNDNSRILNDKTNILINENNNNNNNINNNNTFLLIESQEFENVPKSTRSRLNLEQTIEALNSIQKLIIKKSEVRINIQIINFEI